MSSDSDRIWKEWEEYNHGLQGTMTGSNMNSRGLRDRQGMNPPKHQPAKTARKSAKSASSASGSSFGGLVVAAIVLFVIFALLGN